MSASLSVMSMVGAELRAKRARVFSLGTGILVAATCFGLLSSETATGAAEVSATVQHNFRAAYDILVRPKGAQTSFERERGDVDDGFLSGLFGGITMGQYREVKDLPGVSLAAPVANVGYFLLQDTMFVPLPKPAPTVKEGVYKVDVDWAVHNGLSRYPGPPFYLYYTTKPGPKVCPGFAKALPSSSAQGYTAGQAVSDPYAKALEPTFDCSSPEGLPFGAEVTFDIPVLIAGIDPSAEQQLVGLSTAMMSGNYLAEGEGLSAPVPHAGFSGKVREYPVIASTKTYLDEGADLVVHKLDVPVGTDLGQLFTSANASQLLARLYGPVVARARISPTTAWRDALSKFTTHQAARFSIAYWRTSSTTYRVSKSGRIVPAVVGNNPAVWTDNGDDPLYGCECSLAPPGSNDTWYRSLQNFGSTGFLHKVDGEETWLTPQPRLVGVFDPAKLRGFSPLSQVPLQTFYPPTVTAGNAEAKKLLGTRPLGPTTDLGGYLSQPPLMLTTIQGAIALDNGYGESVKVKGSDGKVKTIQAYTGASAKAPISTLQVRVKGVTGPNPASLRKIGAVASRIRRLTGLTVDVTAGSSPTTERIVLAPGKFGQPALVVHQDWVKKGVGVRILHALATKDVLLLVLVVTACALSVAGTTTANVRERRTELAILSSLAWTDRAKFALVTGEAALVGLASGVLATLVTGALDLAGVLRVPGLRLSLIMPVAVLLAILASFLAAWRAARVAPLDALRPPVRVPQFHRPTRSTTGLVLVNVLRTPGRSLVALGALALGTGAFTIIIGVEMGFRGGVGGDLLGGAVNRQVSGTDIVSALLVVVVGAAAVVDVVYTNLRERQAELAVLRAVGWPERYVLALVVGEGIVVGAAGSFAGAAVGLVTVALAGAAVEAVWLAAAAAALAGVLVTSAALLALLSRLDREAPAIALANDQE